MCKNEVLVRCKQMHIPVVLAYIVGIFLQESLQTTTMKHYAVPTVTLTTRKP